MDEDRDQEEFKHVCRLCNKRFPSGKSLGGHMRSHVIAEARKNKLMLASLKKVADIDDGHFNNEDDDRINIDDNEDDRGNSGYGLRENPKKTWRIVDSSKYPGKLQLYNSNHGNNVVSSHGNNEERVCKQCGKGFHSLKALCGHMSKHSDKERHLKEEDDNSWSSDSIDQLYLEMEGNSDNNITVDNNNSKRQTRSSLSRYNNNNRPLNNATNDSLNVNNGGSSSNYSEVVQLEQEEVAICLMMLSRDSSASSKNWFNFGVSESSDNNSVILEGGKAKKVDYKMKSHMVDQEMVNSDSGYFENGGKEIDYSDDSVDGFANRYGFNDSMKRNIRDVENYPSKKMENDYFYTSNNNNNSQKIVSGGKYECWICSRSFKTHQALGGHIISHRKNGEKSLDNSKNLGGTSTSTTKKGSTSKKVKGHKCPYCPKVFKSGQALGGHKRSHMIGSNRVVLHSEGRLNHIPVTAPIPEPELRQPLLDLNLPAPMEEETSCNSW